MGTIKTLENKTAVVTGAAKGIGKAIAFALADAGCNIVLNYRSSVDQEVIDTIQQKGVACLPFQADVGDFKEAEGLIKAAKKEFGTLDILVNNAGITKDMLLIRMKEEEFDSVIRTNLKGTFHTIRHAAGIMLKQKSGAIINLTSVVGITGNLGQANYAASKAGVIGLTRSTAKELASRGVTCNAVAPGFIDTDMTRILTDEVKKQISDSIPLQRMGTPEDVARAVLFFAENPYITGQVLNVDGGMVMG